MSRSGSRDASRTLPRELSRDDGLKPPDFAEPRSTTLNADLRREMHRQIALYLTNSCSAPRPDQPPTMTAGSQYGSNAGANLGETLFDAVQIPRSVEEMLRLVRRFELASEEAICAAILYMQRFLRARECTLTRDNLPSLFVVSMALAAKFLEDVAYNNLTFAQLADTHVRVFNALEIELLRALRFHLAIEPHRLDSVFAAFISEAQRALHASQGALLPSIAPASASSSASSSASQTLPVHQPQNQHQQQSRNSTPSRASRRR